MSMEGLHFLEGKLRPSTLSLLQCQVRNIGKKAKGCRFTDDDKILALQMLKTSPKGYRFLQTVLNLPSRKTLTN